MLSITNVSTYKFANLKNLKELRSSLLQLTKALSLKGTILLSEEGLNMFVAGARPSIDQLVSFLHKVPGLEDLAPKLSESTHQPFSRMLVKIKKEIIAFGVESVKPAEYTSKRLPAKELKAWLDAGKEVVLFDTRNDYEVKLGTFKNALPVHVNHFRDFPAAVRALPADLKDKTIVTFCTGGIRCEKAAPFMEQEGFKNIYQLDGGILKYFEECGGSHYDGGCFVFDQRVGVDPMLLETEDKQCFLCLSPLTADDQKDPRYVLGKSCPYCFKTPEEKRREELESHQQRLLEVTSPLPGKTPYHNYRPLKIPGKFDGFTFIDFVSTVFAHVPREHWEKDFEAGLFLDNEKKPVPCSKTVRTGERYLHLVPHTSEPDVNASIKILHEDEAIIVVDKPAPLPVHPCGRYHKNTLQSILATVYSPLIPRPAHRLDANTSGVMVFSKSKHFAKRLQNEFATEAVEKKYLATIIGHPTDDSFSCNTPIVDETIEAGARITGEAGLPALTTFKVLRRNSDGTSLVEAQPKTGRTNQIRAHLWSLGFPIDGDPVYLPKQKLGSKQTLDLSEKPLALKSSSIRFRHPVSGSFVTFKAGAQC